MKNTCTVTVAPADSPRETVLLAATGMSPAILTETIWALALGPEPIIPHRVVVVTTSAGRHEIENGLMKACDQFGGMSPWEELRHQLQKRGCDVTGRLRFGLTGEDLRIVTAVDPATQMSRELADIRTPFENEAAADFLLELIRSFVENSDIHLVVSLAGGRKTMGALIYACMTLAGRESDRLTHVLVSEPFELLRGFWFPAQPGPPLKDREGREWNPVSAKVELADVPFVPLRNLFLRDLGRPAGGFMKLVEACRDGVRRQAARELRLTVEQSRRQIEVNGSNLDLAPREHLVMLFLATRAKRGEPAFGAYSDAMDPLNEFRDHLRAAAPPSNFADWRHGDALKNKFEDDQEVRRAVASIRNKCRGKGGDATLLAAALPERGRFSIDVPAGLIYLKD